MRYVLVLFGYLVVVSFVGVLVLRPAREHASAKLLGEGTSVAPGGARTCAVTIAGRVKRRGRNSERQFGDGTTTHRWTPVDGRSGASALASL